MTDYWICFDIETTGREDVLPFLGDVQPDKRLTDQAKIAIDIGRKQAERMDKLPLDANGNQIVVFGWQTESCQSPVICSGDRQRSEYGREDIWLRAFWIAARHRTLIGFKSRTFDLPVIIQRSRILGIEVPPWRELVAPYGRSKLHIDLYDEWTLDGLASRGEVPNNLTTVCRQNGIDIPDDDVKGSDIADLLKAGDMESVRQHCARDVERVVALARKLGFIPSQVDVASAVV